MFTLGLIINPLAGLGGSVALKGSDQVAEQALALGAEPKAHLRMAEALAYLVPLRTQIRVLTGGGAMGEALAREMGFQVDVLHQCGDVSTAEDTRALASAMMVHRPNLILFAGGDGTARDLCAVVGEQQPVLGVPAGVKIHSGVYGLTPKASGIVAAQMVKGELVSVTDGEVRDIDEAAFRAGQVRARYFGEMTVPEALRYVQAVKMGGREDDALVTDDIAAEVAEMMEPEWQYVMGSGSTVAAVMAHLGLENTLLGVDLIRDGQLLASDLTAAQLLERVQGTPTKLVITLIGGQGHLFGRGNQQLSPAVIRAIGRDNILILASKNKLTALGHRPMVADTGDTQLDSELQGHYRIITGYRDAVLYPLANPEDALC
ncbi:ATP-NAD kinase family protein [Ferrimonas balearica]|uniref:ATP-NAD kinase family protein n=1 Tax=Ferrimonas balearica TaxID=44012 RepID=UPI001C995F7A|nr:ATP-NAD kinase family protein [Ferrimonas balearica]MBY5922122.1 ATP-NAD kinase family protein [Ferrimonas balearica]MBY5994538.1 ATP-NAD kinase family protein [Ferrimonas balearica]